MEILKERLKAHEGLSLVGYLDTKGKMTIGYGHNLNYPIPIEAAEIILNSDIAIAVAETHRLPRTFRKHLNVARGRVVTNMIFNMGRPRFLTFKKMIASVEGRDFEDAAIEMLDSKWADQVGKRAVDLAEIMRHGG